MRRIGIDVRLAGTGGGIARYIDVISAKMHESSRDKFELFLYGNQPKSPYEFGVYQSLPASFLNYYAKLLPQALVADHIDALLAPSAFLPLKRVCRTVAIVQDVYALKYHEFMDVRDSWSRWALRDRFRTRAYLYALKHADVVVAVSKNTASDIARFAPKIGARCRVIYSDVPQDFSPDPARVSEGYLLYVGGFNTHKNVEFLVRAHGELNRRFGLSVPLVLAGYPAVPAVDVERLVDAHGCPELTTIHLRPTLAKLIDLYRGCGLFVYLSRYEGFGLPILEAIRCGAPVLINDVSSMPEIAPFPECRIKVGDAMGVAEKMAALLSADRQILVEKLQEHAQRFSASEAVESLTKLLIE